MSGGAVIYVHSHGQVPVGAVMGVSEGCRRIRVADTKA